MSTTLWPDFAGLAAPRGMMQMLHDAAGDIGKLTDGAIDFHVDALGIGASGAIRDMRYNCYLRVISKHYMHLLFRVTTPVAAPFPAEVTTPEGESYPGLQHENELRDSIQKVLRRERTKEVVLFLLNTVTSARPNGE